MCNIFSVNAVSVHILFLLIRSASTRPKKSGYNTSQIVCITIAKENICHIIVLLEVLMCFPKVIKCNCADD